MLQFTHKPAHNPLKPWLNLRAGSEERERAKGQRQIRAHDRFSADLERVIDIVRRYTTDLNVELFDESVCQNQLIGSER